MKYSISYNTDIKLREKADEIRVPLNKLGYLYDFIKAHPNKRYVIILDNIMNIDAHSEKQINYVKAVVGNNYSIECNQIAQMHQIADLGYNFYYKFGVADWESFGNLMEIGVTDIFIDGPLGFDINTLSLIKEKHDINVRVRPNISSNAAFARNKATVPANSFFIRPEDLSLYEKAIDILVFDKETSPLKEEMMFNIYHRGYYDSNISDIIHEIYPNINNQTVHPNFAQNRTNCRQKCKSGSRCSLCISSFDVANKLYN